MRNLQPRLVDDGVAVDEDVEVDDPGAEAGPVASAPELALDLEQPVEERPRRKLRVERRGAVEEAGLVEVADRVRLAQLRQGDDLDPLRLADQLDRPPDRPLAVAEVRPEAHVRPCRRICQHVVNTSRGGSGTSDSTRFST